MGEMKRSTAIAIKVAVTLAFVAIVVVSGKLLGPTLKPVVFFGLLICAPLFLWGHSHHMRWEFILIALGYLLLGASSGTSWLTRGGAAGEVASTVLILAAGPCVFAGTIGYWRRRRAEKRTKSNHPETTQGA